MHIDPFTITVFIIIASFLMSVGLFAVSRSHFGDIKGVSHWATALLLLGIAYTLMSLSNIIANFFSMALSSGLTLLACVLHYHALLLFKETCKPLQWLYLLALIGFIGNVYFVNINFNLNAKIAITSLSGAILLFASSVLLFEKQKGISPVSYRLTATFFLMCASIYAVRTVYYAFGHTQTEQNLLHINFIQGVAYLASAFTIVGISFGFALMCIEKYLGEKNRAQLAEHEMLGRMEKKEQQLRILSVAIEQSPASVMITDADSNLLYVNPKFTEVTGYSAEEVIGKNPCILQSDKTSEAVYEQLWCALKQGKNWHGELLNQRKNGEIYWDETHLAAVKNAFGETTNYVGVKLDITQRKNTEIELLESKQAAEQANQAKSEFLANMSHEIRTPMNAILGFSEILLGLITDKTHLYYLTALNTSGKTLLHIINDILDLSKIEAGKLDLNYAPVKIEPLFADISMMFMQKIAEKDISFSIEISENMPTCLILDEIRVRQVLLNLVGNAVKFTDQGSIIISVTSQPTPSNQYIDLHIAIKDSGMGISADQLESIFSPFTQQKQQSVRYGGTGLGLSICKRLVDMMGGRISVNSLLGEGSCFAVELPHVEVCSQVAVVIEKEYPAFKNLHFQPATVLLVDDVEFNRELIKIYLSEYPELTIIEAQNGGQALEEIQKQRFDLVFMDRQLPGMNGDAVCEKIRALPDYAAIPIIMITASVLSEQPQPFYNIQFNKPVSKIELLTAMQLYLPLNYQSNLNQPLPSAEIAQDIQKTTVLAENQPELVKLLEANYQEQIANLHRSGVFEINTFIDIANQIIKIAEQYHCLSLADWASTLKNQAHLFDIENLTKTLVSFEALLEKLRQ